MSGINILRSFGITEDTFRKALNKEGLVKKKVQVRTKRGVHTAYRWVKPDTGKSRSEKEVSVKEDRSSGYSDEEWVKNGGAGVSFFNDVKDHHFHNGFEEEEDDQWHADEPNYIGPKSKEFVKEFDKYWESTYAGNPQKFKEFLIKPIPQELKGVLSNKLVFFMKYCSDKGKVNMFHKTGLHSGEEHSELFYYAISRFADDSISFRKYMKENPYDKGVLAFKWLTDNMRTGKDGAVRFVDLKSQKIDIKEIVDFWKKKIGKEVQNGENFVFFESEKDPSNRITWDRTLESFTYDLDEFIQAGKSFVKYSDIQIIYKTKKGLIGCDISGVSQYDEKEVVVGDHKKYKVVWVDEEEEYIGQSRPLYNIYLEQLED